MADLHRLTAAGPPVEPDAQVIAGLRELLACAERGEIHGFAMAYVYGNLGAAATGTALHVEPGCAGWAMMVAAAARLFHRVMRRDDGLADAGSPGDAPA